MKNILITGGAGYIGSHTVRELKKQKFNPLALDNLSKGHKKSIKGIEFVKGDLLNKVFLDRLFKKRKIDAVVHFAGSIEVGESVVNPSKFYWNNVVGSINLFDSMIQNKVFNLVFSSSAAVYGNLIKTPIQEDDIKKPTNPYGCTKLIIEQILDNYDKAYNLKSVCLRYFNAAGADKAGDIGEDHDPETHLIPRVIFSLLGKVRKLEIFGDDYKTKDGTCVRDYIHVADLARAHVLALNFLKKEKKSDRFNLGTEKGFSNKQVLEAVEKVTGQKVNYKISKRREGDPAILVASNKKAKKILNWNLTESLLENIIKSAWSWHKNNPKGFGEK